MTDFQGYEQKLQRFKERLGRERFSESDQKLILDFMEHSRALGVSAGRLYKLAWSLLGIRRMMKCDFAMADRKAIETLVADINSSSKWSANTRSDAKKILKRFYKYVRNGNADKFTPYPAEVAWIPTTIKRNEVKEPDVITESEAKTMISAAPSTIDKAMISLLFEGGLRIGEVLGMKVRDLRFDEAGAVAVVSGKTGSRTVRLITSAPILAQFVDQHPTKADEASALWYYFPTVNRMKPMNYRTASMIVKRAASQAGIKKHIHPHLFRHSAATRDSSYGLNERILEIKFGWVKGSKMAGRYTHIQDQRTVDNALLGVYAGRMITPPKPEFRQIQCPRCKEQNTAGQGFCGRCGSPLSPKDLAERGVTPEQLQVRELTEKVADLTRRMEEMLVAHNHILLENAMRLPRAERKRFLEHNGIVLN